MNKTNDILERLSHQPQPVIDNPDELTDNIMTHLPDVGATKENAHGKRWIYIASAIAVAASLLLLMVFHQGQKPTEQSPVMVEQMAKQDEPQPSPVEVSREKKEVAMVVETVVPQKTTKKHRKAHRKHRRSTETVVEEVEQTVEKVEPMPSRHPAVEDQYLMMARQAQDIRSRGERLHEEVAMLMDD
ncbi:MAG: hypothetical protein IKN83_08425 [Bacteroidaceae bacterium]|nr:hypothetical protein [Bacteroidaceae bacterium]